MRLCACGCGQPTKPYVKTCTAKGHVKGEFARCLRGHPLRYFRPPNFHGVRIQNPGASAVHMRLRVDRGPASTHPCVDCGQQARDWSYKLTTGYSTNPADYSPRCRACHKRYDARVA